MVFPLTPGCIALDVLVDMRNSEVLLGSVLLVLNYKFNLA